MTGMLCVSVGALSHHAAGSVLSLKILDFFFLMYYLFLRQSMSRGGAEREGDTESEASSRLRAVSPEPDAGLEPTNREITT